MLVPPNCLNYLLRFCSPNLCKRHYLLVFCPSQSFYGQGWIIWCHPKFYDIPFFSDCEWLYNIQLKTRRGVFFCLLLMPMSVIYFCMPNHYRNLWLKTIIEYFLCFRRLEFWSQLDWWFSQGLTGILSGDWKDWDHLACLFTQISEV